MCLVAAAFLSPVISPFAHSQVPAVFYVVSNAMNLRTQGQNSLSFHSKARAVSAARCMRTCKLQRTQED